jgi:hypothetical protein
MMTYEQFDELYNDDCDLQDKHMMYIIENCHGQRVICNGDTLIEALEDGFLYEDFREDWLEKNVEIA